jgi:hypothetical protein
VDTELTFLAAEPDEKYQPWIWTVPGGLGKRGERSLAGTEERCGRRAYLCLEPSWTLQTIEMANHAGHSIQKPEPPQCHHWTAQTQIILLEFLLRKSLPLLSQNASDQSSLL